MVNIYVSGVDICGRKNGKQDRNYAGYISNFCTHGFNTEPLIRQYYQNLARYLSSRT